MINKKSFRIIGIAGHTIAFLIFALSNSWFQLKISQIELSPTLMWPGVFIQLTAIAGYLFFDKRPFVELLFIWLGTAFIIQFVFLGSSTSGYIYLPAAFLSLIGALSVSFLETEDGYLFPLAIGIAGTALALILFLWQPVWSYVGIPNFTNSLPIRIAASIQVLALFGYAAVSELRKISLFFIWLAWVAIMLFVLLGVMTVSIFFLPAAGLSFGGAAGISFRTTIERIRLYGATALIISFFWPAMLIVLSVASNKWPIELILIIVGILIGLSGYVFFWYIRRLRLLMIWMSIAALVLMLILNLQYASWLVLIIVMPIIASIIQSLGTRGRKS